MAGKSIISFGNGHVASLFILRIFLGLFLVVNGVEKFMNIQGFVKLLESSAPIKSYVAAPIPLFMQLNESIVYMMLFIQIIVGVFILIGLFTRFFTFIIFLSLSYTLYSSINFLLKQSSSLTTTSHMWSLALLAIVSLVLAIAAAGRYIGIDKFIARNNFAKIFS